MINLRLLKRLDQVTTDLKFLVEPLPVKHEPLSIKLANERQSCSSYKMKDERIVAYILKKSLTIAREPNPLVDKSLTVK